MKYIITFLFIFSLTYILQAVDNVSIIFIGPESMHITYHADTHGPPIYLAKVYNSITTTIQEVSGSGSYRYVPSDNGIYRFILGYYVSDSWFTIAACSPHDFQGNFLQGYMYFDETVSQASPAIGGGIVVVPEGISLSLQKCELYYHAFVVTGSISVSANVTYNSSSTDKTFYNIYGPQTLANSIQGEFNFYHGSDGSTFTDGSNITVLCSDDTDVTANNCSFMRCLIISNATLSANDCFFGYSTPAFRLNDAGTFNATDCTIKHLSATAPSGTCYVTSSTITDELAINDLSKGTFNDCKVKGVTVVWPATYKPNTDIRFNKCTFVREFFTRGTDLVCTECDFGSTVAVYTPSSPKFYYCQFFSRLDININSNTFANIPIIENNGFMGKDAIRISGAYSLTNRPIRIDANYFGDPSPPILWNYPYKLLAERNGSILGDHKIWNLQLDKVLSKGPDRKVDDDIPISIWTIAGRYGQGTIPHGYGNGVTLKGRETAFIIDVAVNRHRLDNVEIRALFDGKYYAPTRGSTVTLYRDYSLLPTIKQETAQNTINFFLPPTTQDAVPVTVQYRLTNTNVFETLYTSTIHFDDNYERKLNIHVIPIKLYVLGYLSIKTPVPGPFVKSFVKAMYTKTAIRKKDIHIWSQRPYHYFGKYGSFSLTYLLNSLAVELSAGQAFISCCDSISGTPTIDYTIALFGDGVLKANGVDGASLPLFRNILFTDGDPDALLHEFGHAFGLNKNIEQYDRYPKFGKRVMDVSAFVTDPVIVPGFTGDKRRLRHLPNSNLYWYVEKNFFDIMGGKPKGDDADFWPNSDTASTFHYYYKRLLNTNTLRMTANSPASDKRRIFITGKTAQVLTNSYLCTYLLPESLDIMNITEFSNQTEAGPPDNLPYYYNATYQFNGYTADGSGGFWEDFTCASDIAYWNSNNCYVASDWYRSFDIPTNITRYTIRQMYFCGKPDSKLIYDSSAGGAITTEITSPAPGTEISSDFSLKWNGHAAKRTTSESSVQPLRYMVWASLDNGATWQPQTYMTTATDIDFSYDEIPAGSNIMFRVLSSDGFSTHSSILSDLTVMPHEPKVTIVSPFPNDLGTTGTCWELSADIYDVDDDATTNISWFSSLDGFLGAGTIMTTCYLSIGTHEILCRALDSTAKEGCATVTVHVTYGADYTLDTNSLWLCSTDVGPYAGPCQFIQTGTTLAVNFQMRTPGITTDIKARIRMTSPDSVTTTLATPSWSNISAFASIYHTINILPEQNGTYTFTAELIDLSPTDAVPGDTSCSVSCKTAVPPEIAAIQNSVDFGLQDESSTPTGLFVYVYNAGGSPLIFNQLAVGGPHAAAFTIDNDSLSDVTLSPGTTGTVYIVFDPVIIGRNQAYLALPCNDPWRTEPSLNLQGDYLVPEPFKCIAFIGLYFLLLCFYKKNNYAG